MLKIHKISEWSLNKEGICVVIMMCVCEREVCEAPPPPTLHMLFGSHTLWLENLLELTKQQCVGHRARLSRMTRAHNARYVCFMKFSIFERGSTFTKQTPSQLVVHLYIFHPRWYSLCTVFYNLHLTGRMLMYLLWILLHHSRSSKKPCYFEWIWFSKKKLKEIIIIIIFIEMSCK